MKIAIYKTGHEIADTVAKALEEGLYGFNSEIIRAGIKENKEGGYQTGIQSYACHMAYGILRGTSEVYTAATAAKIPWFHLDRGYFKPGHYDGYYRVSLNGTQQTFGLEQFEDDDTRWKRLGIELKPWRGFDESKPVLICPATSEVASFFGRFGDALPMNVPAEAKIVVRRKGDTTPLNFDDYNYVITFNSSVGWQAIQHGIPCVSDPVHSLIGTRYSKISLADLEEAQYIDRHKLFPTMANLQLTLQEIRQGKIWELMRRLLYSSGGIPVNQSLPTLPHTPS